MIKFLWLPKRLHSYNNEKQIWEPTNKLAWLEWVRVVKNIYGDEFLAEIE